MKHVARKRFGQHFLVDRGVIESIVSAVAPQAGETLVEIGPGLGALTERLMQAIPQMSAIEIDRDLAARLRNRYGERLALHEADALAFDFGVLKVEGRPLRVVGNLPYNISSPLLVHLLAWRHVIDDQHFMLQKEVVERIVAEPGHSEFGRLSVLIQAYYDVEWLFDVPPEAFDPPPRVESAVFRMLPRRDAGEPDLKRLERLIHGGFTQRRKMLRSTLLPWLAQQGITDAGLPPEARPEDVAVADWVRLAALLPAG